MFQLNNLLKAAFRSIVKNRMRSLLTSLGIIIGVSAVIVMVAIGQGAQSKIINEIASLGTNLIIIFPGASRAGGASRGAGSYNRLTMDDVTDLQRQATLLSGISPIIRTGGQVIGGGNNWSTSILGVSSDYLNIRNWGLKYGQFFTKRDVLVKRKVAILGKTVADELFPGQNPVGRRIRIRNTPFKVIGELTEKGQSAMGSDQDDIVLAPSTTVLYRLSGGRHIHMILASAKSDDDLTQAQDQIEAILRQSHRLNPSEDDDFRIRTQAEITEAASATSKTLTLLLGAIAGVSLIVGGIGIMNIMLVSVTERTREIGIRMAVGARGSDILSQFLIEAVVLSLIGGIIGILISIAAAFFINDFTSLYALINPAIVLLAFLFSAAVGIFFGFYPARKAASLNPIDALRYE